MHTVRIATNPRKWRRPAPCPACRKSQPLILTLGTIYKLRTRKPVNTISLDIYRLFEKWLDEQKETER